jgi:putative cardiolipin synthase
LFDTTWQHAADTQHYLSQGLTAYAALDDAFVSIAARISLIRQAQHHLQLQYYIWNNDSIGQRILSELLAAADRGVEVQLLLDDQNGTHLDSSLAALAQHPRFHIAIFNPYRFRYCRVLDYLLRFKQINQRMHNKLLIADQRFAITGGRNISGEYFEASLKFQFSDMDIFFYGPTVQQAHQLFEQFWHSPASRDITQLTAPHQHACLTVLRSCFAQLPQQQPSTTAQLKQAQQQLDQLLHTQQVHWAKASFLADHPTKISAQLSDHPVLYQQLLQQLGLPKKRLDLVSAYFVPSPAGCDFLCQAAQQGISTRVLTNCLAANDVAIVHAFYQRYRQTLLENGVQLYEFKAKIFRKKHLWYEVITGHMLPDRSRSRSSLHAKLFVVDQQVFIGSFNFDPRSAHLNTEVGLALDAAHLQQSITSLLDQYLAEIAYRLVLDESGQINWLEQQESGELIRHRQEPNSTALQRGMLKLLSLLPIEWLL